MDTLKRIEKIILESAFDKKKKKPGLKLIPGLALTGVRRTGPRRLDWTEEGERAQGFTRLNTGGLGPGT